MPDDFEQPAHLVPHLAMLEQVENDYRTIAVRYWDWLGMRNSSPGTEPTWSSAWAHSTTAIATEFGEPANRLYLIAAGAVEAQLLHVQCARCEAPVAAKSRTALDEIARGAAPESHCARCDEKLQREVAKLLDPSRQEARRTKREAARRRSAEREAQLERSRQEAETLQQLVRDRRETVAQTYPLQYTNIATDEFAEFGAAFSIEATTLAILDDAPDTAPIPPIRSWDAPLTPDPQRDHTAVADAYEAGFLRIHPASQLDAFVWSDDDPTGLISNYYPSRVAWYVPHGHTAGEAADHLRTWLRNRTRDWLTTRQGVGDVTAMLAQLIVDETIRYLDHQLNVHNLPAVPDHQRARLIEQAGRLAVKYSLGQCYSVSWRAAANAATMAQRHPRAPLDSATSHAVNTFEEMVTRATTDSGYELREYSTDSRNPLSALTKTVIVTILEADPMAVSVPSVEATLRAAPGFPRTSSLDTATRGDNPDPSDPKHNAWSSAAPSSLAALLADVLPRLENQNIDIARFDGWLIEGPLPIIEGNNLDDDAIDLIVESLDRLTALRATLELMPVHLQLTAALSLAFLMPGVVYTNDDAALPLGRVLGYELTWALGLNGEF